MDSQIVKAITKILLHHTAQPAPNTEQFVHKTTFYFEHEKIGYIAIVYLYKFIHFIKHTSMHPHHLWMGCVLTAIKLNSTVQLSLEHWERVTSISLRDLHSAYKDVYNTLGHAVLVNENEIEEFEKVFVQMTRV